MSKKGRVTKFFEPTLKELNDRDIQLQDDLASIRAEIQVPKNKTKEEENLISDARYELRRSNVWMRDMKKVTRERFMRVAFEIYDDMSSLERQIESARTSWLNYLWIAKEKRDDEVAKTLEERFYHLCDVYMDYLGNRLEGKKVKE